MSRLNALADLWGEAMLRALFQGSLALLIVFGLCALLKTLSPNIRCILWRLAYLKMFVALFWVIGAVSIPLLPEGSSPFPVHTVASAPASENLTSPPVLLVTGSNHTLISTAAAPSPAEQAPSLLAIVMILWGLIALFFLGRLIYQWHSATRLRASLTFASNAELISLYHELCQRLGLPDSPPLKLGPQIESPLLLGIIMPTIALPDTFQETLSREEQEMILAHELAHLRRHDLLWSLLPALAHTLFFFNPLVWLAHRELRLAQEIACDALAVTGTQSSGSTYCSVLVRVASGQSSKPDSGLIMASMAESFDSIPRRINAMKYLSTPLPQRRAKSALALALLGFAGLTPWQVVAKEPGGGLQQGAGRYSVRVSPVRNSNASSSSTSSASSFSSQGSFSGSSGGGGFSTFGPGGSQESSFQSNTSIPIEITGTNRADMMLLAGIDGDVEAMDNLGNKVPGMPSMSAPLPRRGLSRTENLPLQLPDPNATHLTTLSGNLNVINGVIRQFSFPVDKLRTGAQQTIGKVNVRIEGVKQNEGGLEVKLSYSAPPPAPAPDQPQDEFPNAMTLMLQMQGQSQGFQAELLDANGGTHAPNITGGGSGFGGSASGGGSFGRQVSSNSNGPSSVTVFGSNQPTQFKSTGSNRVNQTVGFFQQNDTEGATLQFYIVERQGPNMKVPFQLRNVPLSK
ncbi:MAG: M56 family metallopeptidase [Armatimonas sp.]